MATIVEQYYVKALDFFPFNLEESLESLNYALSYDETHAGANCLLGRVYFEHLRNFRLARYYFEQTIAIDPEFVDVFIPFSDFLIAMSEYVQAQKLLTYAKSIKGVDEVAILKNVAKISEINGEYKNAEAALRMAINRCFCNYEIELINEDIERVRMKELQNNGSRFHYSQ